MVFLFQGGESIYAKPQTAPKPAAKQSDINATLPKSINVQLAHFYPAGPADMDGMPGERSRVSPSNQVLGDIMSYCKPKDTDKDGWVKISPKDQAELRLFVIDKLNKRNGGKVPGDFSISDGVENLKFKSWGDYYDKIVGPFLKKEATQKIEVYP